MEKKIVQLTEKEQSLIKGGLTMMQLVMAAWYSTPETGTSNWTQNGDGTWTGKIYNEGEFVGWGQVFPDGSYKAAWTGVY